jgi:hypothetical protein
MSDEERRILEEYGSKIDAVVSSAPKVTAMNKPVPNDVLDDLLAKMKEAGAKSQEEFLRTLLSGAKAIATLVATA